MPYWDGRCDECGKAAVFVTAMVCLCEKCADDGTYSSDDFDDDAEGDDIDE